MEKIGDVYETKKKKQQRKEKEWKESAEEKEGQKQKAPNVGIEPTTTRLRVVRSTDWAN